VDRLEHNVTQNVKLKIEKYHVMSISKRNQTNLEMKACEPPYKKHYTQHGVPGAQLP